MKTLLLSTLAATLVSTAALATPLQDREGHRVTNPAVSSVAVSTNEVRNDVADKKIRKVPRSSDFGFSFKNGIIIRSHG